MGTLLKMAFAFCIGLALLAGVQHVWLMRTSRQVAIQSQQPAFPLGQGSVMPTMSAAEAAKLRNALVAPLPPIDASGGQRAAIVGLTTRIDIQNRNAQSYVPLH